MPDLVSNLVLIYYIIFLNVYQFISILLVFLFNIFYYFGILTLFFNRYFP